MANKLYRYWIVICMFCRWAMLGAQQRYRSGQWRPAGKFGCWRWRKYAFMHPGKPGIPMVVGWPGRGIQYQQCNHHFPKYHT